MNVLVPPAAAPRPLARLAALRMARLLPLLLALLLALLLPAASACGPRAAPPELPRLADEQGVDPLLLEEIRAAEAASARGEAGALLELAKIYDANDLNLLAERTYAACLALPAQTAGASHAVLHTHRGRVLEELDLASEALAAFDAALALADDYAPCRWRRGQLLLDSGRLEEARADFERALELEPESVPAALGLARTLLSLEDPEGARAVLAAVAARAPEERFVHGLLARALAALGDAAGAEAARLREERATQMTSADPLAADMRKRATGVMASVRRANEALVSERPRDALRILEPLYRRLPDDIALAQMLAKSLVSAGEYERALTVLARARTAHPDDYKLELCTGLALQGKNLLPQALEHLERARALNPAFGPTQAALGKLLVARGQFEAGATALARALECGDVELATLLALGTAHKHLAHLDEACAAFERATREHPGSPAGWAHLAEARALAGDAPAARLALGEAERRNPNYRHNEVVRRLLAGAEAQTR